MNHVFTPRWRSAMLGIMSKPRELAASARWRELVREQVESGLSVAAYCRRVCVSRRLPSTPGGGSCGTRRTSPKCGLPPNRPDRALRPVTQARWKYIWRADAASWCEPDLIGRRCWSWWRRWRAALPATRAMPVGVGRVIHPRSVGKYAASSGGMSKSAAYRLPAEAYVSEWRSDPERLHSRKQAKREQCLCFVARQMFENGVAPSSHVKQAEATT